MRHECWAIQYMRGDGTAAGRTDYYSSHGTAVGHFTKATRIHGPHANGAPRWRLIHLEETKA